MLLTIEKVAQLVNKSRSFVRQHIHRGYLHITAKKGRSVEIDLNEVLRWAEDRHLKIPKEAIQELTRPWTSAACATAEERTARCRILAVRSKDKWVNLLTTIRHRQDDTRSDWEVLDSRSDADRNSKIILIGADLLLEDSLPIITDMQEGNVNILNHVILYDLHERRDSFLGRDHVLSRFRRPPPFASPFSTHSAKLTEFWCLNPEPRAEWEALPEDLKENWGHRLKVDLAVAIDRIGNCLVFEALDEVDCDLSSTKESSLRFELTMLEEFRPGAYFARISGDEDDDRLIDQILLIQRPVTIIPTPINVGYIESSVFRSSDGRCVDHMAAHLLREIRTEVTMMGPEIRLQNRRGQEFHRFRTGTKTPWSKPQPKTTIRDWQLARREHAELLTAQSKGNLFRFDAGKSEDAWKKLSKLIEALPDDPIYLADPYFFKALTVPDLIKTCIDMFASCHGRSMRIICSGQNNGNTLTQPNASSIGIPMGLFGNVQVKSILETRLNKEGKPRLAPPFHDRWLATPSCEYLITHSVTGWENGGVTFVKLPFSLYFAEAERLWNLQETTSLSVETFTLK